MVYIGHVWTYLFLRSFCSVPQAYHRCVVDCALYKAGYVGYKISQLSGAH